MDDHGVRLEIVSGKAAGMWLLVEDELLLGRQADGAGRLAEDQELSRTHARVGLATDGTYTVEDLGSTNGTYVNGTRIHGPRILLVGDMIELGETTAVVRELRSVPPESLADVVRDSTVIDTLTELPPIDETLGATPPAGSATGLSQFPGPEAPPPPAVVLRLTIDVAAQAARVSLDDDGDAVRLTHRDGAWRLEPAPGER